MAKGIAVKFKFPTATELRSELKKVIAKVEGKEGIKIGINTKEAFKDLNKLTKAIDKLQKTSTQIKIVSPDQQKAVSGITASMDKVTDKTKLVNGELSKLTQVFDKNNSLEKEITNINLGLGATFTKTKAWVDLLDDEGNVIERNFETIGTKIVQNTEKVEKFKKALSEKITTLDANKNITGIDNDIIDGLKKSLASLKTGTSVAEFEALERSIDNLSSSDKSIVNLQKKISAYENSIVSLKNKHKDLIPQDSLDEATSKISTLKSLIEDLQSGKNITNTQINSAVNDAVGSMDRLKTGINKLEDEDKAFKKIGVEVEKIDAKVKKHNLTIEALQGKYKDLVPETELNEARAKIDALNDVMERLAKGESFSKAQIDKVMNEAGLSVDRLAKKTAQANAETRTFGNAFKSVAKNLGLYGSVYQIMNLVQREFTEGVRAVIDMDTALTDLNKVVSLSKSELAEMRDVAIQLGEELSRSAVDVAKAQAEFGRMYKDTATINELVKSSIIGANTMGDINSDEVAKGLTSIMSALKYEASDAITIIDSLNEVQNNYKISSKDLLSGLEEVGSVANIAGLSLDEINGYLTAMQLSTGQTGAELGNALNAILSRLFRVGSQGLESAGKSEKALTQVGVSVRDVSGEFRSASDIFGDLNNVWGTLTETQQIYVAQQIAGTQRFNEFIGLMSGFSTAIEATNTSMNSSGSAIKENEIYITSIEGKLASLEATTQGFWMNFINSDMIKGGIDMLQGLIKALDNVQQIFGSLGASTTVLASAFLMFTNNPLKNFAEGFTGLKAKMEASSVSAKTMDSTTKGLGNSLTTAGVKTKGFTAGMKAMDIQMVATKVSAIAFQTVMSMGIGLAIGGAITLFSKLISSLKSTEERTENLTKKSKELAMSLERVSGEKADISRYKEINEALEDSNISLVRQKELENELIGLKERLYEIDDKAYYILNDQNGKYEEQVELLNQLSEQKLYNEAKDIDKDLRNGIWKDEAKNVDIAKEKLENYISTYKLIQKLQSESNGENIQMNGITYSLEEQEELLKELKNSINENKGIVDAYNVSVEYMDKTTFESGRTTKVLNDEVVDFVNNLNTSTDKIKENTKAQEENNDSKKNGGEFSYKDYAQDITETIKTLEDLNGKVKSLNDNNYVSTEIMDDLIKGYGDMYPDLMANITDVAYVQDFLNGKISEQEDLARKTYSSMMESSESYFNSSIKGTEAWGNYTQRVYALIQKSSIDYFNNNKQGMMAELEGAKSLAEARGIVESRLMESLKAMWSEYYSSWHTDAPVYQYSPGKGTKAYDEMQSVLDKQAKMVAESKKLSDDLANISFSMPDFSGIGMGGVDSSSSSASKKEVEDIELKRDAYVTLNAQIEKVSNELEKLQAIENSDKNIDNLTKQNKLLKEKETLEKKLRSEKLKESELLKKEISSWFSFDSNGFVKDYDSVVEKIENWTNSVGGDEKENRKGIASKILDKANSYMDLINKEIPNLDKSIIDTSNDIVENLTNQTETKIQAIKNSIEKTNKEIEKKLSEINYKQSHYADYSYDDNLKFETQKIQLAREKVAELTKEYEKLSKVTATTEAGKLSLSEAIEEVKNQLSEEKLEVLNLKKSIEDLTLEKLESLYQDKVWQKGTQQTNKIDLQLQLLDDDDSVSKIKLMNSQLDINRSMVSDTKKYIQDLNNATKTTAQSYGTFIGKLMEAEETLTSQEIAVISLEKEMKSLAEETLERYINKLKEVEKLKQEAIQSDELKQIDAEYFKVSQKDFNNYKVERIDFLKSEISLIENKLKTDRGNSALLDSLRAKQLELSNIESERYSQVDNWYQLQQDMHNHNIESIDKEIESLREKNEVQDEINERLEKQNELIELQTQLENIKKNKNIRKLTKDENGNYGYEYTYDEKEYQSTLNNYREKQEDLAEWEEQLEESKYIKKLEEQKAYEQESLASLKELYDKEIELVEVLHEEQARRLEEKYDDMLLNLSDYVAELSEKFNNDIPAMVEALEYEISTIQKTGNANQLIELDKQTKTVEANTLNHTLTLAEIYKVGWNGIVDGIRASLSVGLEAVTSFNNSIRNQVIDTMAQVTSLKSALTELASTRSAIIKEQETISSLVGDKTATKTSSTSISIDKIEFRNASSSKEIEDAIRSLDTHALQYSTKRG